MPDLVSPVAALRHPPPPLRGLCAGIQAPEVTQPSRLLPAGSWPGGDASGQAGGAREAGGGAGFPGSWLFTAVVFEARHEAEPGSPAGSLSALGL